MALSSWPAIPPSWLLPWAIWRFRGEPAGQKPPGVPKTIPTYGWEFLKWAAWRRKGAKPPRPDVVAKIPQWGWNLLKQLAMAVPVIQPPPPPPPPPPVPPSSWKLPNPLIYTAWGWIVDEEYRQVDPIAIKMKAAGIKTVMLQIGQFSPEVPDRLRAYGFKIGLWGSPGTADAQALSDAQADGYALQIEGRYEYDAAVRNLEADVGQGLSICTVTTLAGFETWMQLPDGSMSTVQAETLKSLGCNHNWVECYKQGGTSHFPISKMEWMSKHVGMPYFNPVIGLYWDVAVAEYQPDLAPFGKQVGSWLAETMRPQDWVDFAALGT